MNTLFLSALTLPQMDRSVSRPDRHETSATIDLAVDIVLTKLSLGCDRDVQINVAVAGVRVHVGSQGFWNLQSNAAVSGLQPPARVQRGPSRRAYFDGAVSRLEFKFIKPPVGANVPISGGCPQLAVDRIDQLRPIAAAQIHLPLEPGDFDLAVPRVQVDPAFARHVYVDVHAVTTHTECQFVVSEAQFLIYAA